MTPEILLDSPTYFGGKGAAGVVHRIIQQVPRHDVFVSGFLGQCAVLRHIRPAARRIGVELDPAVIALWTAARCPDGAPPAGLEIVPGDFLTLDLPELWQPSTFVYLDPPYLHETRSSRTRYRFELTTAQHRQLLDKVRALPCRVALSCYDSGLYRAALVGWRRIQFPSQSRGGPRLETLYLNYPEPAPDDLHDPRFSGDNFRAREKSKRRLDTIFRKIGNLTGTEQAALLDRLAHLVASRQPAMAAGIARSGEPDRSASLAPSGGAGSTPANKTLNLCDK
ncbi:MAG: hypothetical protein U0U46_16280 [Saprospiraceae bacterium]